MVEDSGERGKSWWQTLPGMLTAAAGLISAVTGLVVAVQQLKPSSHSAPATVAVTAPPATKTLGHTGGASGTAASDGTRADDTLTPAKVRVSFPRGRHVQIGDYRYDILAAHVRAGNPGELGLALRVRMTNRGPYGANFWNRTFRLRVGPNTAAPTNFLDDVVEGGTTDTAEVDFTVPARAHKATLLVGDDPSEAIALSVSLTASGAR